MPRSSSNSLALALGSRGEDASTTCADINLYGLIFKANRCAKCGCSICARAKSSNSWYSVLMQNFALDLERLTGAIFIGEPTGGKPNTHGDESPTILPYSGLHVGLSAVYWQLSSPRDSRLWIAPKIPVQLSAEDYFANRDPALEV